MPPGGGMMEGIKIPFHYEKITEDGSVNEMKVRGEKTHTTHNYGSTFNRNAWKSIGDMFKKD